MRMVKGAFSTCSLSGELLSNFLIYIYIYIYI